MILALALLFLALAYFFMRNLTSQTSDILFLLALDIKKEVLNTKKEVLASNQYIIDILEKKQK